MLKVHENVSVSLRFLEDWLLENVSQKILIFFDISTSLCIFFVKYKLTNLVLITTLFFNIKKTLVNFLPCSSYQSYFDRILIPSAIWSFTESCLSYFPVLLVCSLTMFYFLSVLLQGFFLIFNGKFLWFSISKVPTFIRHSK